MLISEKYDMLTSTLLKSLTHCQYENIGRSFEKESQYAFQADQFRVLTEFETEFKSWLFNADKAKFAVYVQDVYYKIVWYGLLFRDLADDYERQLVCSDGRLEFDSSKYDILNTHKPYQRARSYEEAIDSESAEIRRSAAKYFDINLVPFGQLTIDDNYALGGIVDPNSLPISPYTENSLPQPATVVNAKNSKSKKPPAPPFAQFVDKLKNGFTEEDLNKLLVHLLMKDREGNTLDFKRYLLHPVIDALVSKDYFEKGSREKDQKSLSKFLGLPETRIKSGYGNQSEAATRTKAVAYLQKGTQKEPF